MKEAPGNASLAPVGFDEFALADKLSRPVTVVAQDPAAIGAAAAELLFARIGGDTSPPRELILRTRLIEWGPGRDPGGRACQVTGSPHRATASFDRFSAESPCDIAKLLKFACRQGLTAADAARRIKMNTR